MTGHNPKSSMCKPYTSMCKPKKLTHNKQKFKTPKTANTQTNEWNVENNQHIWDQDQTTNTESHHNIIKSQIESKTRKKHKQMPMHSYIQTHFEQLQQSQKKIIHMLCIWHVQSITGFLNFPIDVSRVF